MNYGENNERLTEIGDRYAGYQVYARHYVKVGKVDDLFVDETDSPEYIGVKLGLLGTRSTLVPMELVRFNDERRLAEVAADKETIEEGPTFEHDRELTPEFEDRVHAYFGLTRPEAARSRGGYGAYYAGSGPTPTTDIPEVDTEYGERAEDEGGPGHGDRAAQDTSARRGRYPEPNPEPHPEPYMERGGDERRPSDADLSDARPDRRTGDVESRRAYEQAPGRQDVSRSDVQHEDEDELRVGRSEEELSARAREREAGSVNVRKRVRTERQRMRVPKRHEEVKVDRVPAEGEPSSPEIGEDEIRVPVSEEEVEVTKRPVKKEEIRIRKEEVEEEEVVEEDVRKEEVEVDDETKGQR